MCNTCSTGCTSCVNDYSCVKTKCNSTAGYKDYNYVKNNTNICVTNSTCISPCSTCYTNKPEICLTCVSQTYLKGTDCVSVCDPDEYGSSQGVCEKCDPSCKTCTKNAT